MSVLIGHARLGSNGKINNDPAGDNNSREVCESTFYNMATYFGIKTYVLRPKTQELASKLVRNCRIGCANDHIGYNQDTRNTAHTQAKLKNYDLGAINVNCATDCSAYMTLCALASGVKELEYSVNAPSTHNMVDVFVGTGKFEKLSDSKYYGSDYLKAGDIVVAPGHHTFMILTDGPKAPITKPAESTTSDGPRFTGVITASSLNIREGAGTSYELCSLGSLRKNSVVDVYKSKVVSGVTWYRVRYNKCYGWASGNYIDIQELSGQGNYVLAPKRNSSLNRIYETTADLNMRVDCKTSAKSLIVAKKGKKVYCNGFYKLDDNGVKWYLVSYKNLTGFMSSKYLKESGK